MFAATMLGGLGLLGSALATDAMGGRLIGLVLYGAAPGVVGWLLARRVWTGGKGVWTALLAVQVWLIVGGLANIGDGSGHGFTQLFFPTLILFFLTRAESCEWFLLPDLERAERPVRRRPRRPFSFARMIRWRRDGGQTSVEYIGLVVVVIAVIGGLVTAGFTTEIGRTVGAKICEVVGTECGEESGTHVEAGDGADTGGATGSGGSEGGTGSGGSEGGNQGSDGSASGGGDTETGETTGTGGSTGGADGSSTGGPDSGSDTYPETGAEPEPEVPGVAVDDTDVSGGGEGDEEDCGGWGFFGCAWDQGTQVVKGVFVDGIWGDLTGIVDLFKSETWSGIADYGGQLGDQWLKDAKDAGEKWDNGDYLDALTDWGGASLNTVLKVGDDVFVGDEVRDRWNNGEKTRAVTDVVWNVGSLFIPGYDVAKVVGKVGKLGKLGKIADDLAEAGDAARRARKAAEAGDVQGAHKAAKEADEAADAAEKRARQSGCTISAPQRTIPYGDTQGLTGASGAGTTVIAAGPSRSPYVILAESGCDEDAKAQAKEARKQADAAEKAADRAKKTRAWVADENIDGPAAGRTLKFPHARHTLSGVKHGEIKAKNSVILKGREADVEADIKAIAEGKAKFNKDTNRYEINGRSYGVEESGRIYPDSGPGIVDMDRNEYAALKEITKANGDVNSPSLTKNPRFANNPAAVAKAKKVYDGTYE
ncbi:hypothetical protein [Streptomyces sp. KR80]|uniref:hypothetical protein n=1 Tax=Streptomyces sp. KR80 TaxID=3457426 RepID=UPI003FD09A19